MAKQADRKKLGTHTEMLPVKLQPSELLDRAQKVGDKHQELKDHVSAADDARRKLKNKETDLTTEVDELLHVLKTGHEPREVEVEAWADYAQERFQEIRTDTGKVIHQRELRPEERQGRFDELGWVEELHLRIVRSQEEVEKRRAGEKAEKADDGEKKK